MGLDDSIPSGGVNSKEFSARCMGDGWWFLRNANQKFGPFSLVFTNGQVGDVAAISSKFALAPDVFCRAVSEEVKREMSLEDLSVILATTVKCDEAAKIVTSLNMLLAQTDEDQFNVTLQGLSSGGKSYIPLEVSAYFPEGERREYSHASPQSLYHEVTQWRRIQEVAKEINLTGIFDEKELGEKSKIQVHVLDLSNKIVVFVDQPHYQLVERLRPFLSHDRKILRVSISDKAHGGNLRTKIIVLIGFASVFFCSASKAQDDQELTRLWVFFPDPRTEKVNEALKVLTKRVADRKTFRKWLSTHPLRNLLQERVRLIRVTGIRNVIIPNSDEVLERFKAGRRIQPRLQRDYPRFLFLIKAIALLNCFHRRMVDGDTIEANGKDVDAAVWLYDQFALPNELGLSAEAWWVYQLLIALPEAEEIGVGRGDILRAHLNEYGTRLSPDRLRRQILPELESAGLIYQKPNPEDERESLVFLSPDTSPISPASNAGRMSDQIIQASEWLKKQGGKAPRSKFVRLFGQPVLEAMLARNLVWVFVARLGEDAIVLLRNQQPNS